MYEELESPVERMRALWASINDQALSLEQRLENARAIHAILDRLPKIPDAEALVREHREKILPVIAELEVLVETAGRREHAERELTDLMDDMIAEIKAARDG